MIFDKNSFIRQKQKLVFTIFLTIGIGSFFYHFVEGWRWLDSIYFSVISLATVGYGDFSPKTDIGKVFTIIYVITSVGLMVAFLNELFDYRKEKEHL